MTCPQIDSYYPVIIISNFADDPTIIELKFVQEFRPCLAAEVARQLALRIRGGRTADIRKPVTGNR